MLWQTSPDVYKFAFHVYTHGNVRQNLYVLLLFLGINFFTDSCAYILWKQKEMNIYIIHYVRFVKRNSTVSMN